MSWKVVHEPTLPHECIMPAKGLEFRVGTIIECTVCNTQWEYTSDPGLPGRPRYFWREYIGPDAFSPIPIYDKGE